MNYENLKKMMAEQVDEDSQRNFKTLTTGQRYLNTDGYNVEYLEVIPETEYLLDIIPFWVSDEKFPDYQKLLKKYGKDEMFDYKLHLWVHRRLGPNHDQDVVCPKKTYNLPCPVCEEHQKFWDMEKVVDDPNEIIAIKTGKTATKPSLRVFMVVIDKLDNNKMKILEYSNFWFFNNLITSSKRVKAEKQVIIPDFTDSGHSIRFFPDKSAFNKKDGTPAAGEIKSFEFIPRQQGEGYDISIMEKAYPLDKMIVVKNTDEIRNILNGESGTALDIPEPQVVVSKPKDIKAEVQIKKEDEFQPRRQPNFATDNREENKCPHGHNYSTDSFMHHECQNCEVSKKCWTDYQNNL